MTPILHTARISNVESTVCDDKERKMVKTEWYSISLQGEDGWLGINWLCLYDHTENFEITGASSVQDVYHMVLVDLLSPAMGKSCSSVVEAPAYKTSSTPNWEST